MPRDGRAASAAAEAHRRLAEARETGEQLSLLAVPASPEDPADIVPVAPAATGPVGPGRRPGAKGKRSSKLRAMLAARGYRMPEDVVAELAGLAGRQTSIELAMARAEQVAAWLTGFPVGVTKEGVPVGRGLAVTRGQMAELFRAMLKEQSDAAAALLPYGLERLAPEQGQPAQPVVLVMPGSASGGQGGPVIEGRAEPAAAGRPGRIGHRIAPPPMPGEVERNQGLAAELRPASDDASRTGGASD